jgi:hypothetical protein
MVLHHYVTGYALCPECEYICQPVNKRESRLLSEICSYYACLAHGSIDPEWTGI